MEDTAKYLIHATITADGIVERSDVVGAVFGQTEGLLGEELDLRDLQQSSRVGRIDVEVDNEGGRSFGDITIATSLDRVETAILAAALETIGRVGPCEARIEVGNIEDVRAAKRRIVVERAKELLSEGFDDGLSSEDIVSEVKEAARDDDVTKYEGLPAGPRVPGSDAVVVVEGRADVSQLLQYGIKNAVAVEGTNVPSAVADLTGQKTTTAFLDGDRGGELILRELTQVGDVDYVAFAPDGQSVEDLTRREVTGALRSKTPYETYAAAEDTAVDDPSVGAVSTAEGDAASSGETGSPSPVSDGEATGDAEPEAAPTPTDTGTDEATTDADVEADPESDDPDPPVTEASAAANGVDADATSEESTDAAGTEGAESANDDESAEDAETDDRPPTLREHVRTVVGDGSGRARLLDDDFAVATEVDAADAFDAVEADGETTAALVVDDDLDQRVLDVAAQRGVDTIVAADTDEFVKQPVAVRVHTAEDLLATVDADG
ncbi:MAG: DNA primase DnaG [Halolamina sp.]